MSVSGRTSQKKKIKITKNRRCLQIYIRCLISIGAVSNNEKNVKTKMKIYNKLKE